MDPASHSSTTTQSKFAVIRDRFVGEIISHSLDHLPRDTHSRFLVAGGFCGEKGGHAQHNCTVDELYNKRRGEAVAAAATALEDSRNG